MIYRVLIAEDEPAATQHIQTLIQMKCPDFEVVGTAENGKEALEQMKSIHPDVLITDVKMPVMDGISLVKEVREKYPEVLSVIISGYQDFEYVQSALRSNVCDYILKPVRPSSFQKSMYLLKDRLDEYYYGLRNQLIRGMCRGTMDHFREFRRVFSEQEYYVALMRKNSLPRRFVESRGIEIFSAREERMMLYGRDEMEALYICPGEILISGSFYQMMAHLMEKEKRSAAFCTLVIRERPVQAEELSWTIRMLYQTLDHRLVIGKNQVIVYEEETTNPVLEKERCSVGRLELLIQERNRQMLPAEIQKCFEEWGEQGYTQLRTEEKVREMFSMFRRERLLEEPVAMCEYYIDEAFYYAETMEKLGENISQILCKNLVEEPRRVKIDTREFFEKIESYMEIHLSENLSPQKVCTALGVSQASLSRLFKKYGAVSFNKQLNILRIEKAKELMKTRRELFIKDVALLVGYSDQFYFSRIFRSLTGLSPTEYMEGMEKECGAFEEVDEEGRKKK